ncbi:MAG: metallophosphoesterase [Bdellovibrionales bacterium]|nr:metallophosphoesterase [Bdellovibrionales bacterium]
MGIARVFFMALALFALAYSYLVWSLAQGELYLQIILAVPFLCILAMPLTVWGSDRRDNVRLKDSIAHVAYSAMGLLTYIFVFTVLRDLMWLSTGYRAGNIYVLVACILALVAGAVVALRGPTIKRIDVKYSELPSTLEGFKVALITDLHVGGPITRTYVERVVQKTNSLAADVVALTGDIGDGDSVRSRYGIDPLADLQPRGRVFYVSGNHEYYWNIDEWLTVFRELGARVLHNRGEIVEHNGARILVGGIPDKAGAQMKADVQPDVQAAIRGGESADFRILLSHRPSAARAAAQVGFDLQVSGHTHAGQFFPWTLVVRAVHEFHEGLSQVGRMWIYVSHGTGTWGPPLRLGTTPEVTLLTLKRSL